MVHSRSRDGGWTARVAGLRTAWHAVDDGEFHCPSCGGDRCYRQLAGRRRLTVLGLPVVARGEADPVVACAVCRGHFPLDVLREPTATRLSALLRDGVHTIALALLSVGGAASPGARAVAVASVQAAGFADCTEERLLTLQAAVGAGGPWGEAERTTEDVLRAALEALAPHLAAPGREGLLLQGARIALSDGPYTAAERDMLAAVGDALGLCPSATEELLTAAAPS